MTLLICFMLQIQSLLTSVCNAKDKKEVESIIGQDPFLIKKIAEYEIIEFLPTKCADGLERFI